MTITKLIKKLQEIAKTNPKAPVLVNWETFESGDHSHEHIASVELEQMRYDNGDTAYREDGSERMSFVVSLTGVKA